MRSIATMEKQRLSTVVSQEDISFCIPTAHDTESAIKGHRNLQKSSVRCCVSPSVRGSLFLISDWTNAWFALYTTTLTDIEAVQTTEGRVRALEEWELNLERLFRLFRSALGCLSVRIHFVITSLFNRSFLQ